MVPAVTEHVARTSRHTTFYLGCGDPTGPLIVFVHGWPELSVSWRHQLACFRALGFCCVAPDMRGYGRSSVYGSHEAYALEHSVGDMIELLDALGREKAVWVGHDWGSPVVWSIASHHPERCLGVANLCVPYLSRGFAPPNLIPLIDRDLYPEADYPAGQWDYMLFYEENFATASRVFEANVGNTIRMLFRGGNPAWRGRPSPTARVRRDGGWFGGAPAAPERKLDTGVLSKQDLSRYVAALERNGFFGPGSWYMNHARNIEFAARAKNGGRLAMPVLFLHAAYDYTCDTTHSRLAEPMRKGCADLMEVVVASGHWMAQEKPAAVNAALVQWLARKVPEAWPAERAPSI
jgi:pimeloyl-ACP methyl ester carboxylesterase